MNQPGLPSAPAPDPITPWHEWTHDGTEVLVVRLCARDGTSSALRLKDGQQIEAQPFRYPLTVGEVATAPDWDSRPVCGGGLHGWAWGFALGSGKDPDYAALWQVYAVAPEDVVEIPEGRETKVKFRSGRLVFSGEWFGALAHVAAGRQAWIGHAARGQSATGHRAASAATGYQAASAATGYQAASAATGDRAASAATGDRAASAATGDRAASAATGDRAASAATGDQAASSGQRAAVVTGCSGRARSGAGGCIALAHCLDSSTWPHRHEMRCAETGTSNPGALKADRWYKLDAEGAFVECEPSEEGA